MTDLPDLPVATRDDICGYEASRLLYHELAEKALAGSDTYILTGIGASVTVRRGALCLQPGAVHGERHEPVLLYRGAHRLKQLIIATNEGHISLAALAWCSEAGIAIIMLGIEDIRYTMLPGMRYDASLRRRQYALGEHEKLAIAKALIEEKIKASIETIEAHLELRRRPETLRVLRRGVLAVSGAPDIEALRQIEAAMAAKYFGAFVGVPLPWTASEQKRVPPHWRRITARSSLLSPDGNARHATNPFHATLNYLYAVAESQLLVACHRYGLDASVGVLHAEQGGKPVLCYDLVEPLRARIDHQALSAFGSMMLTRGDVAMLRDGRVLFNPELLRFLLASCRLPSRVTGGTVAAFVGWLRGVPASCSEEAAAEEG